MTTLRVGYLTKRRDACWWLRILNPMSHLNLRGHETVDEVFERQAVCPSCAQVFAEAGKPYYAKEINYDEPSDCLCTNCNQVMITADTRVPMTASFFEEWRQSIYKIMEEKDLIAFQRPTDVAHLRLMREAKRMGKKIIQLCDDDYQNVPEWNSGYKYYMERQGTIQETLRIVDAIDVTTPYLLKHYAQFNKNVTMIPNSLDMDLIDLTPAMNDVSVFTRDGKRITTAQFEEMRAGKKFFLWGGSPTHQMDLDLIVGAMRRLVRTEEVCLGLVGYAHWPFLEVVPYERLFLFSLIPCMQYFMAYKGIRADVGLAPVAEIDFNRGKSPLKALEYQALGILPVMSDFETYRGCSPQGIYAKNDEYSWYCALRKAVHCEDRQLKLDENKKYIEERYNMKHNVVMWENSYQAILNP